MKKLLFLTYICWVFQIAMSYLSNYSIFSNWIGFMGQNSSFKNDLNDYRNFGAYHFVG